MARREADPENEVVRGTGNVFVDLGYPDAEERQAKLRLAYALNQSSSGPSSKKGQQILRLFAISRMKTAIQLPASQESELDRTRSLQSWSYSIPIVASNLGGSSGPAQRAIRLQTGSKASRNKAERVASALEDGAELQRAVANLLPSTRRDH